MAVDILTPIQNATIPKTFNANGSCNGPTVVVTVKDKDGNVVATGNANVANGVWHALITVANPGGNPHTVTATGGGEFKTHSVIINSLLPSETDDEHGPGDDDPPA